VERAVDTALCTVHCPLCTVCDQSQSVFCALGSLLFIAHFNEHVERTSRLAASPRASP